MTSLFEQRNFLREIIARDNALIDAFQVALTLIEREIRRAPNNMRYLNAYNALNQQYREMEQDSQINRDRLAETERRLGVRNAAL